MAMTRRHALRSAGLAALGAVAARLPAPGLVHRAFAQSGDSDLLVVVFARGGYDALNMIVPYGEGANYYDRRKNIAIPAPDSASAMMRRNPLMGTRTAAGASGPLDADARASADPSACRHAK